MNRSMLAGKSLEQCGARASALPPTFRSARTTDPTPFTTLNRRVVYEFSEIPWFRIVDGMARPHSKRYIHQCVQTQMRNGHNKRKHWPKFPASLVVACEAVS